MPPPPGFSFGAFCLAAFAALVAFLINEIFFRFFGGLL